MNTEGVDKRKKVGVKGAEGVDSKLRRTKKGSKGVKSSKCKEGQR